MLFERSHYFNKFKDEIGQANHFLITILIGLDALEDNPLINKRENFRTTWNPNNRIASISRSRDFAKKAALSWCVDCLDSYLRDCNTKPKLITNIEVIKSLDDIGNSVYKRCNYINTVADINPLLCALIDLIISWRNNLIHSHASNQIINENRNYLIKNYEKIESEYCNLDIRQTLERFDKCSVPTFKETTSLIRATIDYVKQVDKYFISTINTDEYLENVVEHYFHGQPNKEELISLFKNSSNKRKGRKVENILKQYSISGLDNSTIEMLCERINYMNQFE